MKNKIFTADNEFPDCGQCDHVCDDMEYCNKCGPEYGWANYRRTEWEEEKCLRKKDTHIS